MWKAEDYANNPERWTHVFSQDQIDELSTAADAFIASGVPLTGISKAHFPLPTLESFFGTLRREILNGKGFILFKGIPVEEWSLQKSAVSQPVQNAASFVADEMLDCIHGSRRILWLLCEPEWTWSRTWTCERSWRGPNSER